MTLARTTARTAAAAALVLSLSCSGAGKAPAPAPESPLPGRSGPADPAPSEETAVGSPQDRYQRWLAEKGASGDVLAGPDLGNPTFRLFFVSGGAPGQKLHAAAASATDVVAPVVPPGPAAEGAAWQAFLRSAPPAVLQDQIGWLFGSWSSHAPSRPASAKVIARDPKNQQYVAEPTVNDAASGVVFEAFYGEPPSFDPFRVRIEATAAGATVQLDPVWQLP